MKPQIKINGKLLPNSYEDISWSVYVDYSKSGLSAVDYFTSTKLDVLQNNLYEDDLYNFVYLPLSFLSEEVTKSEPKVSINILDKSIQQKIVSINILNQFKDNVLESLPYLVSVYLQDASNYSDTESEKIYKEVIESSFLSVYNLGLDLVEQISKNEKHLEDELKNYRIPVTVEDKNAGVESLERFNDIALIFTLANFNFLEMGNAKKKLLKEVTSFTIYKQRLSYFEWKRSQLLIEKTKKKR